MAVNVTQILSGPALVKYAGATFYSKSDITLEMSRETFNIEVDRFQKVDERMSNRMVKVKFTPAGEWENLSVLFPYFSALLGSKITPIKTLGSINTTSEQITLTAHGLTTGMGVRLGSSGTLPAGLGATTTYFVRAVDANTITLHSTQAGAEAGTGTINITDTGTGTHKLIVNTPLVIHTFEGKKITLHNAAVVKMPDLSLSSVQTLFAEVEFEAFPLNNTDWSTSENIYTIADESLSDTTFDAANILTVPFSVAWGSSAPWSDMQPSGPIGVSFGLQLEPVEVDGLGLVTRMLAGLEVSARFAPLNVSESDLADKLLFQGGAAARGKTIGGSDNLNIVGPSNNPYIRIYGAGLKGGPQVFSSRANRIGELEWIATRTFAAGVPNPLAYVGTSAPA